MEIAREDSLPEVLAVKRRGKCGRLCGVYADVLFWSWEGLEKDVNALDNDSIKE